MVYLDNWTMLNLIQTNKLMNKNKTYVYMIIFQTIKTLGFNYNGFSFKPPMGKTCPVIVTSPVIAISL